MTAASLLIFWSATDGKNDKAESSARASSYTFTDTTEDTTQTSDTSLGTAGPLFSPYREIVRAKVYKLTTVRQKRFGGNSVPVTTVTYYGNDFINIVEMEGHDTFAETYINADGAYAFDTVNNTVHLFPADTVTPENIFTEDLVFMESGTTTAGVGAFTYEKYKHTATDQIVDYLFADTELKKMKIYTEDGYDLVSVEISDDISGARTALPEGITVIDNR